MPHRPCSAFTLDTYTLPMDETADEKPSARDRTRYTRMSMKVISRMRPMFALPFLEFRGGEVRRLREAVAVEYGHHQED